MITKMQVPKTIKIYSKNNYYQHAEVLKLNRTKRLQYNKFFVEGVKSINLAISNNWEIDSFLYSSDSKLSNWATDILKTSKAANNIEMPLELMRELSEKEDTSELIALIKTPPNDLNRIKISRNMVVMVLDRPSNPGNLGTIIRNCDCFNIDGIIVTGHAVDIYDPKTIQASVGTLFSIPVIKVESHNELLPWLDQLKSSYINMNIIGTTVKTETIINAVKFQTPLVLLIGNETFGLSSAYKSMCDTLVKIPIGGSASSLNVASATAIFLYEIRRYQSHINS